MLFLPSFLVTSACQLSASCHACRSCPCKRKYITLSPFPIQVNGSLLLALDFDSIMLLPVQMKINNFLHNVTLALILLCKHIHDKEIVAKNTQLSAAQ